MWCVIKLRSPLTAHPMYKRDLPDTVPELKELKKQIDEKIKKIERQKIVSEADQAFEEVEHRYIKEMTQAAKAVFKKFRGDAFDDEYIISILEERIKEDYDLHNICRELYEELRLIKVLNGGV
jgi:hypothetical protein